MIWFPELKGRDSPKESETESVREEDIWLRLSLSYLSICRTIHPHQSGTQREKTVACSVELVHRIFPPHHLKTSGTTQTDRRGLETKEEEK